MPPSPMIDVDPPQLRARAAVYRLLGRLWLRELDSEVLGQLLSPPLQASFRAAGGVLPEAEPDDALLEDLAVDYCQLFLGPSGHLPPHQSVWTAGQFQGEATSELREEYTALGVPLPDGMPDHLGSQLTAMAIVLETLSANGMATVQQLDAAEQFFDRHLTWADDLCEQAIARAQTSFYRSTAEMTKAFLAEERIAWQVPR